MINIFKCDTILIIKGCVNMNIEEIKKLPKVELHLHLDGSVNTKLASKLLNKTEKEIKDKMNAEKVNNLEEYLEKFDLPISIMQTRENLIEISKQLALDLKEDNIIYAEIRFAPIFHTKEGLTQEQIVDSVLEGLNTVKEVKTNLILCLMRGTSHEENLKTLFTAHKYLNNGVVGIDLAGAENLYPNSLYKKLIKKARALSIPITIHAGEASNYKSVVSALKMGAKRIGHGIKSVDNDKLINRLVKEKIVLEVCPTSNLQTKIIKTYNEHPIKKLYDKKVLVTINTDNKTVSNITLSKEYEKLHKTFNFNKENFKQMNINAINGAFISNQEKQKLKNIIEEKY